jgi:dTDP-4-amino-4,6-dideoxygalactose transaminase
MITKFSLLKRIEDLEESRRQYWQEYTKLDNKIKSLCSHPKKNHTVLPNHRFTAFLNGYPSASEVTGYRVTCTICDTLLVKEITEKEAHEYRISISEAAIDFLS